MIDDLDFIDKDERPSKTQRKLEMTQLQKIGEQLLTLNRQQRKKLALPEQLVDALLLADRISKKEALRRQAQYIGRLMRGVDEETLTRIKRYLEALNR